MNDFELEKLLGEALSDKQEPPKELNEKLKKRINKRIIFSARRYFKISAVGVAAAIALFAVALNINGSFNQKVSQIPVIGNVVNNEILLASETDIIHDNTEIAKARSEDDTEVQTQNRQGVESLPQTNKAVETKQEDIILVMPEQEPQVQARAMAPRMAEEPQNKITRAMPDEYGADDEYDESIPMTESLYLLDKSSSGGASAVNENEESIPVKVDAEDIKTVTDEEGKKYSLNKDTNERMSVEMLFEDGYDYQTALEYKNVGKITGDEDFYLDENDELHIIIVNEEENIEFNVGKVEKLK